MLDLEKFGQILREARERKNLTCRDVGQALDLTPSYYRSMEKGRHCPRLHRAIQICALLDISFDDMARKMLHSASQVSRPGRNGRRSVKP